MAYISELVDTSVSSTGKSMAVWAKESGRGITDMGVMGSCALRVGCTGDVREVGASGARALHSSARWGPRELRAARRFRG